MALARTMKRDYGRVDELPNSVSIIRSLPVWFIHSNRVTAQRSRSPRAFIASRQT